MNDLFFKSDLNLLNDRINNLSAGLAIMPESGKVEVNKTYLSDILTYMEELLKIRHILTDTGLLAVDSEDIGLHYFFNRARGEVAILFQRPRRARRLTFGEVRGPQEAGEGGQNGES
jgi:hypothetical protein